MTTMTQQAQAESVVRTLAPTAPPVFVEGLRFAGVTLHDWAFIATLIYTGVMFIIALPKLVNTLVRGFKWLREVFK